MKVRVRVLVVCRPKVSTQARDNFPYLYATGVDLYMGDDKYPSLKQTQDQCARKDRAQREVGTVYSNVEKGALEDVK